MTATTPDVRRVRASAWRWLAGLLAIAFGLATLIEGGPLLLGGPAARAAVGHVVPFVLAFNVGAGLVYVLTGAATLARRRWAAGLARALAASTLVVFAALGVHVLRGGAYMPRTPVAMTARSLFWIAQAIVLPWLLAPDVAPRPREVLRRALGAARRALPLVAVAAVALLVAWLRVWSPVRAEAVRVDRGPVVDVAFGRGTVESQREAAVGFDLVGRLSDVLVDEGARVTLGQELARLETDQAQADLHTAQTGVAAARTSLRRLAADEEKARAVLATAEREVTRTQQLFDAGAAPGVQLDEATDRARVARADLDRVLAQRAEATRSVEVASGGAEQRRVAMVRATLLAPFDGLVTRRLREPGDTVTVGSTVLRIVDTDRVYVAASVDETVLPRLAVGQRATITFPGDPAPLAGAVTRIGWEADRQTHELVVEVTPDRLDRRVAIGQRADVRVELARQDAALRVPSRLVHHDGDGAFVYVDRGGRIARVRPTFGIAGDDYLEVSAGLAEGDVVLAAPGAGAALPVGRRWRAP